MKKGLLILAAAAMTLAPMSAPAAVRGFVVVGRPYYGGFYRPFWGPYWGYGPGYYGPVYTHPNSGEVKLDTKVKTARTSAHRSRKKEPTKAKPAPGPM